MSNAPENACSNSEIKSVVELAEQNKRVEFSARLSADLNSQSPADALKFIKQLQSCIESERPNHPNLPHLEITQSPPPPKSQSI